MITAYSHAELIATLKADGLDRWLPAIQRRGNQLVLTYHAFIFTDFPPHHLSRDDAAEMLKMVPVMDQAGHTPCCQGCRSSGRMSG